MRFPASHPFGLVALIRVLSLGCSEDQNSLCVCVCLCASVRVCAHAQEAHGKMADNGLSLHVLVSDHL